MLDACFLSQTTSYDVASNSREAQLAGAGLDGGLTTATHTFLITPKDDNGIPLSFRDKLPPATAFSVDLVGPGRGVIQNRHSPDLCSSSSSSAYSSSSSSCSFSPSCSSSTPSCSFCCSY